LRVESFSHVKDSPVFDVAGLSTLIYELSTSLNR